MTSVQEPSTWPNWIVDDVDDFLGVLLPNSLTAESNSQMSNVEKNDIDMQVYPYNNKSMVKSNKNNNDLDIYLSNWAQQDCQISSSSDQQLTESEMIDRMTEDEKIDYLAELMLDEPSQPKTQTQQNSEKGMNNTKYDESNTTQCGTLSTSYIQDTVQYSELNQLPNTNTQKDETTINSEFLNLVLSNEVLANTNNYNFHHDQYNQNNKHTMDQSLNQNKLLDKQINQDQISRKPNVELQNKTLYQNLQRESSNQQCSKQNGNIESRNCIVNKIQCSIKKEVNRKGNMIVNNKNKSNSLFNKIISIQNANRGKNVKYVINKKFKTVQVATAQEQAKNTNAINMDNKGISKLFHLNKAVIGKRIQVINKSALIQHKNTLQNRIKSPVLNKGEILSIQGGKLCVSSNVTKIKQNKDEKINPEASCTKKRKKYEEDPLEDEEEEKKRLQAKKAKNYRDKKKEEFRIKDDQIEKLQEALQKCEREKNNYMIENKQLKEELKVKEVLLQLYEGK